ncbi:MAG: hypothetical protein KDJ65_15550 [Anaerolineae bacterium]|nr:hypothetical protein [Anaerolineae bacterium]
MISYITPKDVSDMMHAVATTPPDDTSYITDQMMKEQPALVEYLFRLDDLPFDLEETIEFSESERDYIFYICIVVWKILSQSTRPTPTVTWSDIFSVIDDYEYNFVRLIKEGSGKVAGAALQMIEEHPEPELLRFITDAMRPRADDPNFPPIRPEYHAIATMVFQIVLTAMFSNGKHN